VKFRSRLCWAILALSEIYPIKRFTSKEMTKICPILILYILSFYSFAQEKKKELTLIRKMYAAAQENPV
jgi:hypothetical protein